MEENIHIHEKIDAYLSGSMEQGEKEKFEAETEANPGLKEELRIHKTLVTGIKDYGHGQFKARLKEMDEGMADVKLRPGFPKWMAYAASLAMLIGLGVTFLLVPKSKRERLFAEHFQTWQNDFPLYTRGEIPEQFGNFTANEFEDLKKGADFYDAREYKDAINVFKNIELLQSNNEHLQFLLGMSYLNNEQPKKALPYFEALVDKPDFEYNVSVKWYYGMTLVLLGEEEKAQQIMDEVAYSDSPFAGEAKEILKALND